MDYVEDQFPTPDHLLARKEIIHAFENGEGFIQTVAVWNSLGDHFNVDFTFVPSFKSKNPVRITGLLDVSLYALTITY